MYTEKFVKWIAVNKFVQKVHYPCMVPLLWKNERCDNKSVGILNVHLNEHWTMWKICVRWLMPSNHQVLLHFVHVLVKFLSISVGSIHRKRFIIIYTHTIYVPYKKNFSHISLQISLNCDDKWRKRNPWRAFFYMRALSQHGRSLRSVKHRNW